MATASPQSKIVIASPLRRSPRQAPTRQSVPPAAAGVASAPGGAIRASTSTTGVVSAPATGAAHTACPGLLHHLPCSRRRCPQLLAPLPLQLPTLPPLLQKATGGGSGGERGRGTPRRHTAGGEIDLHAALGYYVDS